MCHPWRKNVIYLTCVVTICDIMLSVCRGNNITTSNDKVVPYYNTPLDVKDYFNKDNIISKHVRKNNNEAEISFGNKQKVSEKPSSQINTINHFKINSPKRIDNNVMIINNNVSFVKRLQGSNKTKIIFNIENIIEDNESLSTSELIDKVHFVREKALKNFRNKKYHNYEKDFPEDWHRILEDGKRKKDNIFFYEVPLIDEANNGDTKEKRIMEFNAKSKNINVKNVERKKSPKIVSEDQFIFNPEKPIIGDQGDIAEISERFLNIFQVVKFNNKDCYSANGVKGICLHPFECQITDGTATGSCAEGYGVCCVYQYSCGDQTSSNCSTFANPNFPKPSLERLSCTFTVNKAYPGVTQLRLEIIQLELQPPTNGTCVEDQFVLTGQNINNIIPILCGINNDQHLYVEVGDSSGPFYISVMTSKAAQRLIQVRVCQLGPEDERVPQGCLQYHKSSMGFIESFNYRADGSIPGYRAPGYTNNLNYAICISRAPNTCSITYTNYDENGEYVFQISNFDSEGIPLLPPGQAGVEIFNCPDDYIVVNGIRLCGERLNDASLTEDFTLNAPVTETGAGPIVFVFRTNGNSTGRGFRLLYRQNPCTIFG